MRKFKSLAVVLTAAAPVFAGLIDHGDYTGFPNVNVDAHLVKIGRFYYPEVLEKLPEGMPRSKAWRHDITEAAKGLNIPADRLEKFIDHVIRYYKTAPVPAPHEKLLEFELYAAGRNELFYWKRTDEMPPSWQRLFIMPVEKRRYVTIPVLYAWNRFCDFRRWYRGPDSDALEVVALSRRAGCFDTQGCERALIDDVPQLVHCTPFFGRKLKEYQNLFRSYVFNCRPEKEWRYTNAMDSYRFAECRGDAFFGGTEMPPLRYSLMCEKEETLRRLCTESPALRDLIVAVGLTNYQMGYFRKIAFEFAPESELNYPVLALRVPLADAEKLLAGRPEHAALLDLLRIKNLSGMAKVRAIDAYIAKYPDYTPKDMPVTSIALNTHNELRALAGLELFKLGRPREALERWVICGTPEDIAIVAEQLFDIDELIDFCRLHTLDRGGDFRVSSSQCAKDNKLVYPKFIGREAAEQLLRNILARRLMRAGRFDEARKWAVGWSARESMEGFMRFRAVMLDPKASRADKLAAALSLGALIRFDGDRLFGTFLEPDNTICNGRFRCEWGTKFPGLKLNKPALPRFHYRWIAAEFYRQAAEYTDDPKLKGFCFWMAGTLLKNRDPKLADEDFKKLFAVRPELTENNWFKPRSKCPDDVKELYCRRFFVADPRRLAEFALPLPKVDKVGLPKNDGSAAALLKIGIETVQENCYHSTAPMRLALYALNLAGEKGSAEAYAWCGLIHRNLDQYMYAVTYCNKALALDPGDGGAKVWTGLMYMGSGYRDAGLALVRDAAENERSDKKWAGLAAFALAHIYADGDYGVAPNEVEVKRWLDIAEAKGLKAEVESYRRELAEMRGIETRPAAPKPETEPAAETKPAPSPKPAAPEK